LRRKTAGSSKRLLGSVEAFSVVSAAATHGLLRYSCAFGGCVCHRSEPDWHFKEKPIHLSLIAEGGAVAAATRQRVEKICGDRARFDLVTLQPYFC
jgi:hypothetical protein